MKWYLRLLALGAVLKYCVTNHCNKDRTDQIVQACAEVHGLPVDLDIITIISDSNFVTNLCTNLDCFFECFKEPLSLCRFNETKSLKHDLVAYRTTFRYICSNVTDAANIYQACRADIETQHSKCRSNLDLALIQAEANLISTNDSNNYQTVVCQAYSYYTFCMELSNSSTCPEQHVQKINTTICALYSRAECGITSDLSHIYNYTGYCNLFTYPNGILNTFRNISNLCSVDSCSPYCVSYRMSTGCSSVTLSQPWTTTEVFNSYCSNIDCTVDCMNEILKKCSFDAPWLIQLDTTVHLAYARHICQNITFALESLKCASDYQNHPCFLASSISDYINARIKYNNGDLNGFTTAVCRTYLYTKQCSKYEASSSCTESQANYYNEIIQTSYSLPGCNDTSPLMQRYNLTTSCSSTAPPTTTTPPPPTATSTQVPTTFPTTKISATTMTTSYPITTTTSDPITTTTTRSHPITKTTTTSHPITTTTTTSHPITTTTTTSHPITTTTATTTPPAPTTASAQMPTTSTTKNTMMTTASSPITTTTSTTTTTTTTNPRTTTTTENSVTCTSVNSDIIDCLTQYNLPSYNLTEYVINAVTICEKLECIMGCIKTAVGDCYKNNILYFTYDTMALIATYRYMCDNFNETLQSFRECASAMQTKASMCLHNLSTAITQAERNYVTDKNKMNYLSTMCSGISTYATCVTISASGNCTATFATRINTVHRSWYSYYQCAVTSELYATYYQDPECTQNDAAGTIYGKSLIRALLLLGSLCLLYFLKY